MRPTKASKKLPFEPFFYRLFTIYQGLQTKRIISPFTNVSKRLKMKTVGALAFLFLLIILEAQPVSWFDIPLVLK
jgi:hypothetical protein